MDETPNVNNLNGVPNFGHGIETTDKSEQGDEGVEVQDPALGDEEGSEGTEQEAGDSDRPKRGRPKSK